MNLLECYFAQRIRANHPELDHKTDGELITWYNEELVSKALKGFKTIRFNNTKHPLPKGEGKEIVFKGWDSCL